MTIGGLKKDHNCLNKKEENGPANWWPAISQEMVCVLVCESVSRSNGSPQATLKGQGSVQEISVCRGTDNTHTHRERGAGSSRPLQKKLNMSFIKFC